MAGAPLGDLVGADDGRTPIGGDGGTGDDRDGGRGRDGGVARRALLGRAVALGAAAWITPVVLGSLASPAAAGTPGPCAVYVLRLDRSGNSGNANVVLANDAGCATAVTGLAGCSAYLRVTENGSGPAGTVTFSTSGFSTTTGFGFSFAVSAPSCVVVGQGSTAGVSTSTACAATVAATAVADRSSVSFTVPSANVINARAWAYVVVRCG